MLVIRMRRVGTTKKPYFRVVVTEAKTTVWAKIPGIKNSRYDPPPGNGIAPPKTKANSKTNNSYASAMLSGMNGNGVISQSPSWNQ